MSYPASTPAWAIAALWLAGVAGCAGDSWLQTPYETELPLDPPVHLYPTAVHPSFKPPAGLTASSEPQAAEVVEAVEAGAANPPATEQRLDKPQSPVTPLAAVPPQYRTAKPADASQQSAAPAPTAAAKAAALSDDADLPPVVSSAGLTRPGNLPPEAEAPRAAADDAVPVVQGQPPAETPTPTTSADAEPRPPIVTLPGIAAAIDSTPASAETAPPADRPARIEAALQELIAALEADVSARQAGSVAGSAGTLRNAGDEELARVEQRLRIVQLAAGRLDDAVQSVESLDAPQREAYKHLMFALGVWLSPDEARRPPLRSAKVLRSLRDASAELSAASKLELKNLVFCDRVEYFGWYSEFPRYEFRPKQPVILYVEVNNFAAEQKAVGYETELQGSYQIFDAGGRIVAERQLPLDREVCRNLRRDYFLAYPIYMPDSIPPGRYRLELSIEDLKAGSGYQGRKFGEGMIEFSIRP